MNDAQRHRGPDADGAWSDGYCALGHRRLAIIDLSDAGRQPMSNTDKSIWITFNGEIYNYQEIRRQLLQHGYKFYTQTDTEVIINAYEHWGVEFLSRLRGMFALGIWDQRKRRLFLARDRTGKKPLFYARSNDKYYFASELQGLLAITDIPREVNTAAIDAYLSYGYIPAPQTAYLGIKKLPPAHYLVIDLGAKGFSTAIERYWSLDYLPKERIDSQEAGEILREKLTEATRLRLISDVPLGAFLSGGIDSSIVVGLMAGLSTDPVKTFSIGFKESAYNELDHARRIAEMWGTDHHEFIVEPKALEILPGLVRHFGEPYADSSAIPTFYVSQMTRRHVTVALNGDGGDESFAGYERYLGNHIAERLRSIPGAGIAARAISRALPDSINQKSRLRQARRFLSVATEPMPLRYSRWVTFFKDEVKSELYSSQFANQLSEHCNGWLGGIFEKYTGLAPIDTAMAVDISSYLPYDLLVKVDITSMANSLEARSPFLDQEVMEFAARLPAGLKAPAGKLKHLLKQTFSDILPKENVSRRKMGFGVPVGDWFRGPLREMLMDNLQSRRFLSRGLFREVEINRLIDEHLNRRTDYSFQLWSLLMLELWYCEFIDRRA